MFMQKIIDLFKKAVEAVTACYFRRDVQEAIRTVKQTATEVIDWVRKQVKEQPEAVTAGGIIAWVVLTTISSFTAGFVVTMFLAGAAAVVVHYYFTSKHGEVAKAPGH
jgi:hypothetical protein